MKRSFLITLTFVFVFSSCKKDKKKDSDCVLSDITFAGSYKVTSIRYKLSATTPEVNGDDISPREDCEKDDVTTFNADHTVTYTDAGIVCSPDNSRMATWSLTGNVLSSEGNSGTVENFTCSGFTGVTTGILTPGDRVTVTYSRQ